MNLHPQLCDQNFHILHISPLGYVTPAGAERSLALPDGNWPVLPNTALGIPGRYADWLSDCLLAIRWALKQPGVEPDHLSLFGTSQGGRMTLAPPIHSESPVRPVVRHEAVYLLGTSRAHPLPQQHGAFWRLAALVRLKRGEPYVQIFRQNKPRTAFAAILGLFFAGRNFSAFQIRTASVMPQTSPT